MVTNDNVWKDLMLELKDTWQWMERLDPVQRSNAVMALGAGLPVKVLMSW